MTSRKKINYQTYYKLALWLPLILVVFLIFILSFLADQDTGVIPTVLALTYMLTLFGGIQYLACLIYAFYKLKRSYHKKEIAKTLYYLPVIFSFLLTLTVALTTKFNIQPTIATGLVSLLISHAYLGLCELCYFLFRNLIDEKASK